MAQLSRPYQIGLAAVAVLVLVWFVALHGHSGNPSEPGSSSPAPKSTGGSGSSASGASAPTGSAGAPSSIYHGPAPGVEGLTRDIAKAHGAVATSQKNADQLKRFSQQASEEASSSTGGTPAHSQSSAQAQEGASSHVHARGGGSSKAAHGHAGGSSAPSASSTAGRAPQQLQVEHELARGKTVLLLFWEPRSSVDDAVRSQALALGASSKGKLVVRVALADQVGLFGPVTEVAHVYQTPTILIVGHHGLITTLTGLVDRFSLQQAVREAEHANR